MNYLKKDLIMKKFILFIAVVGLSIASSYAQSSQLDFSVQYKNTNQNNIVIYPNPISEPIFNVKSNSLITQISVVDMLGKNVFFKEYAAYANDDITIRLSRCVKGVYLVKIKFDDNQTVIKKLFYQ